MFVKRAIETVHKTARLQHDQAVLVEAMKAEGADSSEAEILLGCYAAAHRQFEKCLQRAIAKREEAAMTDQNLGAHSSAVHFQGSSGG
jgi:hypothetical protein